MDEYFVILGHFLPFDSPNNPKNQNFEKNEKHTWIYHHLTQVYKNHDQMLYCSRDMACDRYNCYFSFWAIFCTFTTLTTQKIKTLKK